ncbi:hypothetical protein BLOT_000716 [Blomia tropicalis]|nr:hypothetical protein BLOT_000716 [Blomia tropicalis]
MKEMPCICKADIKKKVLKMQPKLKPGLLVESNSIIKDVQLESIIRRDEPITDYYDLEKDCFARMSFAMLYSSKIYNNNT